MTLHPSALRFAHSSKHFLFMITLLCLALSVPLQAGAVPTTVASVGRLLSSGGAPAADGKYPITFSLFKTELGGLAIWTEPVAAVTVSGGQFQYVLGSTTPLDAKALSGNEPLWLEVKVEPEAALPRVALHSVALALRAGVAEAVDCSGCIGAIALDPAVLQGYVKTASLAKVALTGAFSDLSGGPDLSGYVKAASLANVAQSGQYADLSGKPAFAAVAASGAYADLNDTPILPKVGAACGSGLVMRGILADGSYDCVASLDPNALPADGLNKISNNTLTNQFTDVLANAAPVPIPDNWPKGISDTITVGDIGTVQSLSVSLDLSNSDVSTITVTLTDPAGGSYTLWDKSSGVGGSIKKTWPTPDKLVAGNLGSWAGKNPKGNWTLQVIDAGVLNNAKDGAINAWSINLTTLSSKKVSANAVLQTQAGLKLMTAASDPVVCDASQLGFTYYNTANNALYICNGKAFFPIPLASWGTSQANPVLSCKDLKAKDPTATTGIYWVDPDGPSGAGPAFQDYCDQAQFGGGWTMAVKWSVGNGSFDPQAVSKVKLNMDKTGELNPAKGADILSAGTVSSIAAATEALAVVYKGGVPVFTAGFALTPGDLAGSWAKAKFIKAYSSVDITDYDPTMVTLSYPGTPRLFYITHNHGGCGNDAGALAVAEGGGTCAWENGAQFILYWTGQSPMWGNYTTQAAKDGEVLMVLVR